jgi:hypothetical protein
VGEPLTGYDIIALAHVSTPVFDDLYKCSSFSAEVIRDKPWVNGFGQNCEWLFNHRNQFPGCIALDLYELIFALDCYLIFRPMFTSRSNG